MAVENNWRNNLSCTILGSLFGIPAAAKHRQLSPLHLLGRGITAYSTVVSDILSTGNIQDDGGNLREEFRQRRKTAMEETRQIHNNRGNFGVRLCQHYSVFLFFPQRSFKGGPSGSINLLGDSIFSFLVPIRNSVTGSQALARIQKNGDEYTQKFWAGFENAG